MYESCGKLDFRIFHYIIWLLKSTTVSLAGQQAVFVYYFPLNVVVEVYFSKNKFIKYIFVYTTYLTLIFTDFL